LLTETAVKPEPEIKSKVTESDTMPEPFPTADSGEDTPMSELEAPGDKEAVQDTRKGRRKRLPWTSQKASREATPQQEPPRQPTPLQEAPRQKTPGSQVPPRSLPIRQDRSPQHAPAIPDRNVTAAMLSDIPPEAIVQQAKNTGYHEGYKAGCAQLIAAKAKDLKAEYNRGYNTAKTEENELNKAAYDAKINTAREQGRVAGRKEAFKEAGQYKYTEKQLLERIANAQGTLLAKYQLSQMDLNNALAAEGKAGSTQELAQARSQGFQNGYTKGFNEGAASKGLVTNAQAKAYVDKMKVTFGKHVQSYNATVKARMDKVRAEEQAKANKRVDNARAGGYESGLDDARKSDALQALQREAFEAGKKAAEMQAEPNTKDAPVCID
jgi:hypothetical protein